jgi:hypothetical protein
MSEEPTQELETAPSPATEPIGFVDQSGNVQHFGQPEPTLPPPSEGIKTGEPLERIVVYRKEPRKHWHLEYRADSGVIFEYDLKDWAIRLFFLVLGLAIGWIAHGNFL